MRSLALWRAAGLAVLLAVVALVPLAGNVQLTQVGVLVLMYVGAAVAWNIFSGFTGYISLGAAVFFGVGVYTVALITQHLSLVGGVVFALYPLGGLVAAVVAVPFGLVALRVRRHTFVVVTIAVFFIFQLMASNFSWTGGVAGLIPPFLNWDQATVYNPFYYTALLIAVASAVLAWAIWGSRFGLQLRAIRDDEDRARGLGVKTMRVKLTAFVISGFIIGMLGGLYFYFQSDALPHVRVQPVLRPDHRPDGVHWRVRHSVRAHLRRAAARALSRLGPAAGDQHIRGPDRPRRAVPDRDHLPAAGHPANRGREADRL